MLMMMKAAKLGWAGQGVDKEQGGSQITKFHPNFTKNIEIKKIFYWLALNGWSSRSEK